MLGKLPLFEFCQPSTLKEALALMAGLDGDVCPLAGGTDLLVGMKSSKAAHGLVLDVKRVAELNTLRAEGGRLCIGAALPTRALSRSLVVRQRLPLLSQALAMLGSVQIGNRATLGGNLANASPAADSAPALLALEASVRLAGPKGERLIPLEKFFLGPGKTVITHELIAEVSVPTPPPHARGVFYKLGPRGAPEDIGIVSVALLAVPDPAKMVWKEARISLGAVAPTPIRARHAEEALRGQLIGGGATEEAARLAAEKDSSPISDIRGTAGYRRAMVRLLVSRALQRAAGEIRGAPARE